MGTSGYDYYWNKRRPSAFEWYVGQGFNSVEINATFYRYPTERMVEAWRRAPLSFGFSVKVNRAITHYSRFSERCVELWESFVRPFKPLEQKIVFWLYQLPPQYEYSLRNLAKLREYFSSVTHIGTPVVEFRSPDWWAHVDKIRDLGVAFCSVSAPELPDNLIELGGVIYLRLHGKTEWYSYVYSEVELDQIADMLQNSAVKTVGVYLNNDWGMFENAVYLAKKLLHHKKK